MAYLSMKSSSKTAGKTTNPTQMEIDSSGPQAKTAQPAQNQPGTYIDYNESTFASTSGERIIFFHAPWCFQCREIEKDIKANLGKIPAGVTIFKIDYDSNQDLRKKYGVKLQTSFVKFDASGKVTENFVAYDEPTFANLEKNIL